MRILLFLITSALWGFQVSGQENEHRSNLRLPAETMEIHLARTCYFPEEVVVFALYCTNPLFPGLELSTRAFVELISEQNASVLRQKIQLKEGSGAGSFQLPANLPSGIYTLLVYTNWLKNFGEGYFHRHPIVVLNPEHQIPVTAKGSEKLAEDSERPEDSLPAPVHRPGKAPGIQLSLPKTRYVHREKVTLSLQLDQHEDHSSTGGRVSVSVHLLEPKLYQDGPSVYKGAVNGISIDDIISLPDYQGLRLTGTVTDSSGQILPEADVILSRPGPGTILHHTRTGIHGVFNFLLPAGQGESDLVFTLPVNHARISLEDLYWNGFRDMPPEPVWSLDESDAAYLEKQFTRFQLKQKLNLPDFSLRSTPPAKEISRDRFYAHPGQTLYLDDYIRLDSLPEYFYELIPSVSFVQNRMRSEIRVVDPISFEWINEAPGVFLDGVLYPGFQEISRIPVRDLDRITVLPEVYHYRDLTFGGIIDIHTKTSDFSSVRLLPNMIRLIQPLTSGDSFRYNTRDHSTSGESYRAPDLRSLLCWIPGIRLEAGIKNEIDFYTGDVPGVYVVKVCGITSEGELVQSETRISVCSPPGW